MSGRPKQKRRALFYVADGIAEYNKAHKDETEGNTRHLQGVRNETSDRDDGGHRGARDGRR